MKVLLEGVVYIQCTFIYKCGTFKLARRRFTMLKSPSPRIRPLASTMIGVSLRPFHRLHHKLRSPPIVRANVNDGVLYIPDFCQSADFECRVSDTYQQQQQSLQEQNRSTSHSALSVSYCLPKLSPLCQQQRSSSIF